MHSSAPRQRGFTPPRRSGITHLASPHYITGHAATSHGNAARPLLSTSAPPTTTMDVAAASTLSTQRGGGAAATAATAAPAQASSCSVSPPRYDATSPFLASQAAGAGTPRLRFTAFGAHNHHPHQPSSQHPPRSLISAATAPREASPPPHSLDGVSWRHHVSAVCRRLERTMQETEQVLMRAAGPDSGSTQGRASADGAAPGCSSVQLMDALQRYRSVCMAALLELEALQQRHFSAPPSRTRAPAVQAGSSDDLDAVEQDATSDGAVKTPPPPPSRAADVAQLQRRYTVMESRLAKTLAAQAAYMDEITLQQHQREHEGIMGEYLWTARLLVEQESAERSHLQVLWDYLASAASTTTAAAVNGGAPQRSRWPASELSAVDEAAPVEPLPPPPMKSPAAPRAASAALSSRSPAAHAASPRLQLNGHGDAALERLAAHNAHLTRELAHAKQRTHALLQEQQQDLQAAQERALAQLVARHCAQTDELEQRARQAEERLRGAQHNATRPAAAAVAPPGADDAAHGALQQQLKDTTKRMWQLHLVNDHLDAKLRVAERELEELRSSRSPLRGGQQRNGVRDGSGNTAEAQQTSEPPLRIAAGASRPPSAVARPAVQLVARLPTTSSSSTGFGLRGGGVGEERHGVPHGDVRYGAPLALAAAAAAPRRTSADSVNGGSYSNNSGGGGGSGAAQLVGAGVWMGYDERSAHLAAATTLVKQQHSYGPSHSSSLSSLHSMRWADEAPPLQRPPAARTSQQQQHPPHARVAVPGSLTSVDVSRMSEDANYGGGGAGAAGQGDDGATFSQPQRSFTRTLSPVRQLSLDRMPVPLPPRTAGSRAHTGAAAAADAMRRVADDGRDGYSEGGETDNELDRAAPVGAGPAARGGASTSPDFDDDVPPLTAPHDAGHADSDVDAATSQVCGGGADDDDDAAATAALSTASSCTSPTATAPRSRLEAVRRDILRHAERLEQEVQAVTSRHDAARRQRRRERDTLRVNLSVHSAKSSPAPSMSREDPDAANAIRHHHAPQDSGDAVDNDAEESEALNRALEELHIEQQEEDDALEQYYNDVNQKRAELERCLRAVEEKLAALA